MEFSSTAGAFVSFADATVLGNKNNDRNIAAAITLNPTNNLFIIHPSFYIFIPPKNFYSLTNFK
jgi:hypothetical protein